MSRRKGHRPLKAYENLDFMNSTDGRILRILAEMLEPASRFRRAGVKDSIVMFGSARFKSPAEAQILLERAEHSGNERQIAHAKLELSTSAYYQAAQDLARRLTEWSMKNSYGYVIASGGGPGIMEAANRGASEVKGGRSIGLNIALPFEQEPNPYISDDLNLEFNYFFVRKFWFAYLAKAIVVFPGGFGTFDELFEILTLIQTKKTAKQMPIVLYSKNFWGNLINFDYFIETGVISAQDLEIFRIVDSVDEAFSYITDELIYIKKIVQQG